ncbi:MAG: MBL fold metallo-hydrolase [Aigarchaeota archaeon]|nr:MBL fold metallo-hydrolase [Candidatus Pelearchaeum maunauluense]
MYSKVADGVYVIDTGGLGFDRTIACYLIHSDKVALVDAGYARGYDRIMSTLRELGISSLDFIIPTHVHLDHYGCTGLLAKAFPNSRILAHKRAAKHVIDPSRVLESARSIFGERIAGMFGDTLPVEESRVEVVDDGAIVRVGDSELRIIYTPGHAPHQLSVYDERRKILITADAVAINYPDFPAILPTTPPPSFDPDEAVRTIHRIAELDAELLLTPHFGPREGGGDYLERNAERIREWVEKVDRLSREGKGHGEIVETLVGELAREVGAQKAPPYVVGSVHVSVLGMLKHLGRL